MQMLKNLMEDTVLEKLTAYGHRQIIVCAIGADWI